MRFCHYYVYSVNTSDEYTDDIQFVQAIAIIALSLINIIQGWALTS